MRVTNNKIRMSKTFKRFALSFLVVLLLPIIIFINLFIQSYRQIYRNNIIEQASNSLKAGGMELERNIEDFHIVVAYNSISEQMSKQAIMQDYTAEMVISVLKQELVTNSILDSIAYYNVLNPDMVYTEQGTFSSLYYKKLYAGFERDILLTEYLQERGKAAWLHWRTDKQNDKDNKHFNQYMIRGTSNDWWIFTISNQVLEEILYAENSVTEMKDADGNILYSTGEVIVEKSYEIIFDSPNGYFQIVRYLDEEQLFAELNAWQSSFFLVVFVLLLVGGGLIIVLTYYNEHPIKELVEYCHKKFSDAPENMGGLEAFQFAMKSMEEQMSLLETKEKRNRLLLHLLYSQECDTEYFKNALKEEMLLQDAECYRVIFAFPQGDADVNLNKIGLYMKMVEQNECEFCIISRSAEVAVVMIVGMSEIAERKLKKQLEHIADVILENAGERICFFVGEKCTELKQIHNSFVQVLSGVRSTKEIEKSVIYYVPSPEVKNKFKYPNEELNTLYDALVTVDLDKANVVTNKLTKILEEHSDNDFVSMSLYYDVMNTYYRAWMRLDMNGDAEFLDADLLEVREHMDVLQMIQRIEEQYKVHVEGITGKRDVKYQRVSREEWIAHVLNYIDENCDVCDLSVSMVADQFSMSISHLSHKFKEQTNRNISDYIIEKKLTYASELLTKTEYSVKNIAEMTGYSHPASFIRKFKQQYGVTPAEYRSKERTCTGE